MYADFCAQTMKTDNFMKKGVTFEMISDIFISCFKWDYFASANN